MAGKQILRTDTNGASGVWKEETFVQHGEVLNLQVTLEGTGAITGTATFEQSIDGIGRAPLVVKSISGNGPVVTAMLTVETKATHIYCTASGLSASTTLTASVAY